MPQLRLELEDTDRCSTAQLKIAGLFAGIGGIELGLHRAGHQSTLLCEIESTAQRVLKKRFPDVELVGDVRDVHSLPDDVDILAAGFPCQDLSQAGRTEGIVGSKSGVVDNVFRLLSNSQRPPRWLLIENVPFMLQLERGKAMHFLTDSLESLGFRWAYRVINARCFGLPQRRRRVIMLASCEADPREVLFSRDAGEPRMDDDASAFGFYWTEGSRGVGWAIDSVPTIKGGSTVGIPSPPAIWLRSENRIVTPHICDAERLQGFRAGWTQEAVVDGGREGIRWKLVGNAVCVPVAQWLGEQLSKPRPYDASSDNAIDTNSAWPRAAWGDRGRAYSVDISEWPCRRQAPSLVDFLKHKPKLLSERAAAGFLSRALASSLRFHDGFLDAVANHIEFMRDSREDAEAD